MSFLSTRAYCECGVHFKCLSMTTTSSKVKDESSRPELLNSIHGMSHASICVCEFRMCCWDLFSVCCSHCQGSSMAFGSHLWRSWRLARICRAWASSTRSASMARSPSATRCLRRSASSAQWALRSRRMSARQRATCSTRSTTPTSSNTCSDCCSSMRLERDGTKRVVIVSLIWDFEWESFIYLFLFYFIYLFIFAIGFFSHSWGNWISGALVSNGSASCWAMHVCTSFRSCATDSSRPWAMTTLWRKWWKPAVVRYAPEAMRLELADWRRNSCSHR